MFVVNGSVMVLSSTFSLLTVKQQDLCKPSLAACEFAGEGSCRANERPYQRKYQGCINQLPMEFCCFCVHEPAVVDKPPPEELMQFYNLLWWKSD